MKRTWTHNHLTFQQWKTESHRPLYEQMEAEMLWRTHSLVDKVICVGICIKFVHFVRSSAEELHVLIIRLFSYVKRFNTTNIITIHTLQY